MPLTAAHTVAATSPPAVGVGVEAKVVNKLARVMASRINEAGRKSGRTSRPVTKLGTCIRLFRHAHDMDQYELAYRMGMTRSMLSKLERGVRAVYLAELPSIADALGLSLEELVVLIGPTVRVNDADL